MTSQTQVRDKIEQVRDKIEQVRDNLETSQGQVITYNIIRMSIIHNISYNYDFIDTSFN